jgi:hydrogenase maturation protease
LTSKSSPIETLILGVGNVIMGDDGFGARVAQRLQETALPENVKVEEGGTGGFNLLGSLEGVKRVIVIDIMMADIAPGEVLLFKPGPNFGEPGKRIISFHQVGVLELVRIWGLLGYEPDVYFLVTRPDNIKWGTELSPNVQPAVDKAIALLEELIQNNFAKLERSLSPCTL